MAPTPEGWWKYGMSATHHSLNYHLIFDTKHQEPTIASAWRERLHAYLGGCVKALNGVPLAIGGMADHVHLLVSLTPTHTLADVLRDVKRQSSAWIHDEIFERKFGWQDGYGAFTVSVSVRETVREYILGQDEHHRRRTFREEYVELLEKHGVEFKEEYLW
jgi:REP element-mobilizing transposase RayT